MINFKCKNRVSMKSENTISSLKTASLAWQGIIFKKNRSRLILGEKNEIPRIDPGTLRGYPRVLRSDPRSFLSLFGFDFQDVRDVDFIVFCDVDHQIHSKSNPNPFKIKSNPNPIEIKSKSNPNPGRRVLRTPPSE